MEIFNKPYWACWVGAGLMAFFGLIPGSAEIIYWCIIVSLIIYGFIMKAEG